MKYRKFLDSWPEDNKDMDNKKKYEELDELDLDTEEEDEEFEPEFYDKSDMEDPLVKGLFWSTIFLFVIILGMGLGLWQTLSGLNQIREEVDELNSRMATVSLEMTQVIGQIEGRPQAEVVSPTTVTRAYEYVVKSGDTLTSISRDLLGNANRWELIVEFNELSSSNIYPGMKLLIPIDE